MDQFAQAALKFDKSADGNQVVTAVVSAYAACASMPEPASYCNIYSSLIKNLKRLHGQPASEYAMVRFFSRDRFALLIHNAEEQHKQLTLV